MPLQVTKAEAAPAVITTPATAPAQEAATAKAAEPAAPAAEQPQAQDAATPAEDKAASAAPAEEAPATAPPATPAPSRVAAMIARKERELQRRSDELKAEAARIKAAEERIALLDKAGEDPTVLAKAAGLSLPEYYQRLTKHILADGKPDPAEMIGKTNAEISALKAELQRRDEEAKQSQTEHAKLSYLASIEDAAKAAPDGKYEMLAMYGKDGANEVLELQIAHFNKTGKPLTDEDAMARVESDFRANLKESLDRLYGSGFFAGWLKERQAEKQQDKGQASQPKASSAGIKTLGQSTMAAPVVKEPQRRRTRDEEFEDFIAQRLAQ